MAKKKSQESRRDSSRSDHKSRNSSVTNSEGNMTPNTKEKHKLEKTRKRMIDQEKLKLENAVKLKHLTAEKNIMMAQTGQMPLMDLGTS